MQPSVDAYLAYNEQEHKLVEPIAHWLTTHGVSNHFFARDKQYGQPVDNTGDMGNARAVIAFLGAAGWGPNHLRLVELARQMDKPVYPVLIGALNPGDAEMAGGLFKDITWVDARNGNLGPLDNLLPLLREQAAQAGTEADAMVDLLIAGPDERRQFALDRLVELSGDTRPRIAARLRHELLRYAAGAAGGSSSSDPSYDANAEPRSWLRMALIRCDPESDQTQDIVLRDMSPDAEPAAYARFWSLAAARQAKVSYLVALAHKAAGDPTTSVSFAGRAMLLPGGTEVADLFRTGLHENDRTKRGVLRALRIVHVEGVVPDVCAMMASPERAQVPLYDVFCALATPEAAVVAAPILAESPGTAAVVDLAIEAARDARRTVTNDFGRLLATLDAARARELLNDRSKDPQQRRPALQLLEGLDKVAALDVPAFRHIPGFAADTIAEQDDRLGIQAEVQTLAAIMVAREVTPPLAIGLFGEWGSGKSFFMSQMDKTVEALAKRPDKDASPYCSSVVQITFNAWHYAETNLWASLVSTIFEKLAVHMFGGTPDERQQAALIAELASAKAVTEEARAEERRASEQLEKEQTQLDKLRKERLEEEQKLAKFNPTYLIELLKSNEQLKTQAEAAFDQLGLPAVLDKVDDFKRAVADAGTLSGRTVALVTVLSRDALTPLYAVLFVLALVAVPAGAYLLQQKFAPLDEVIAKVGPVLAGVGAFFVGAAGFVRRGMRLVDTYLKPIVDAKKKADEALVAIRSTPAADEITVAAKVEVLKVREQEARRRVADAAARVAATEERLRELEQSRDLARFIADRHDSSDYRKHLGLVSLVRRDFEALTERIRKHGTAANGGRKVERIVLYIDDLDRCPAAQVVDVLQAVHLLLAYPLFVVVVGVDSRWLTNSLAMHYKELGAAFTGTPEAAASPQHYLEKIFQIPYSLRPMSPEGYGKLVGGLVAGGARAPIAPAAQPAVAAGPAPAQPTVGRANADTAALEAAPPMSSPAPDAPPIAPQPASAPVEERALVVRPWEEQFATSLYTLIPSPRAAKRLINVYRVLKAGVGSAQLPAFEGNEDMPGQFQVPLLLLAMQICDPATTAVWFRELLDVGAARDGTAEAFERTAKGAAPPARTRLMHRIHSVVSADDFPHEPALLARWIPLVSRFTFDIRPAG